MAALLTYPERRFVALATVAVAALALSGLTASAQDFMERSHKQQGPQPDVKPKVDERAYKDALQKIPPSKEKYDPWGVARPSDDAKTNAKTDAKTDAKTAKKPN